MAGENINHLKGIIEALIVARVDFVVCGGVAMVLHGVERATLDIDLAISHDRSHLERFIKIMGDLGLRPRAPVPASILLDPEGRKSMQERKNALVFTFVHPERAYLQVDVFLDEQLSYDVLKEDIVHVQMGSSRIPILSPTKLIELKENVVPPRDKDLFDIKALKNLLEKKNAR